MNTTETRTQPPRPATTKPRLYIGIDPGVHTGFAAWAPAEQNLLEVSETTIYEAIEKVRQQYEGWKSLGETILVRIEDARLRKWFGRSGPEVWKGAGSVIRDCKIWEEAMTLLGIPFQMVHPKDIPTTDATTFKKMTGWQGRTNEHARKAAWLVFGK